MKRTRLELYLDILKTLGRRHQLNLSYIMHEVDAEKSFLKTRLDFLVKQRLVEQIEIGKEAAYYCTRRGITVSKVLHRT